MLRVCVTCEWVFALVCTVSCTHITHITPHTSCVCVMCLCRAPVLSVSCVVWARIQFSRLVSRWMVECVMCCVCDQIATAPHLGVHSRCTCAACVMHAKPPEAKPPNAKPPKAKLPNMKPLDAKPPNSKPLSVKPLAPTAKPLNMNPPNAKPLRCTNYPCFGGTRLESGERMM